VTYNWLTNSLAFDLSSVSINSACLASRSRVKLERNLNPIKLKESDCGTLNQLVKLTTKPDVLNIQDIVFCHGPHPTDVRVSAELLSSTTRIGSGSRYV
jgi:hypothetical protein